MHSEVRHGGNQQVTRVMSPENFKQRRWVSPWKHRVVHSVRIPDDCYEVTRDSPGTRDPGLFRARLKSGNLFRGPRLYGRNVAWRLLMLSPCLLPQT